MPWRLRYAALPGELQPAGSAGSGRYTSTPSGRQTSRGSRASGPQSGTERSPPGQVDSALGLLVALAQQSRLRPLRLPAAGYVWLFRSLPLLVLLIFVYNSPSSSPT